MTDIEQAKQIVADAFNGGLAAGRKNGLMEAATLLNERASLIIKQTETLPPDAAAHCLATARCLGDIAAELLELAK